MLSIKNLTQSLLVVLLISSITLIACSKQDSIEIRDQWVKATHEGQDVGAAFLTIISKDETSLISVESDVAENVEIHSMVMDDGIMKMSMLDTLPLPANKPTELKPGGFHLMLFDLKQPLVDGAKAKFTLHFKNTAGLEKTITVTSPIKREAP